MVHIQSLRIERYLEMDPEKATVEPTLAESPARVSQDSQDDRRISFGSNTSDQSNNITKAKKRTLYSQALVSVNFKTGLTWLSL
jgi:hypothetical protein